MCRVRNDKKKESVQELDSTIPIPQHRHKERLTPLDPEEIRPSQLNRRDYQSLNETWEKIPREKEA